MKILSSTGNEDLAIVHIAESSTGNLVEFVESLHTPMPRSEKWILTISTLYGCPVSCSICDAGSYYMGRISKEGMFWQLDHMISSRFPDGVIPVKKLKVHFTRMGEPAFNMSVLDVINEFEWYFKAPGFFPSISSIAPKGCEKFFDGLFQLKNEKFGLGKFQLQFSIHTTDEAKRDILMPVKKWDLETMAAYGRKFHKEGDRKITLSFAPARENPIDTEKMRKIFDPGIFLIKLTPLNATKSSKRNELTSVIEHSPGKESNEASENNDISVIKQGFIDKGFEVITSIGAYEEIIIGSTCGQNLISAS
jgi:23S rRNA (adenine2503-C2)-methyltransferase